ncbi:MULTISPECIES: histidine phosphotransferase family protein [unclassified Roseovarius]|uniref:histidine phosphotransferase family protein n=1 Tax=unclassified Roseovarius TaxID=2614913 RepID=UPI00273E13A2|nr:MULTISPECIES: histidine phosphotransferase family protein [unclassified Roseovarius]
MTHDTANVAALIGSRICHDLISPVGAVTNGLELLAMSGVGDSPELSLVNSSAADASARIRLFRLAFGTASDGQTTGNDELRRIFRDHYSDGRLEVTFHPQDDVPRKTAKAVVLAVLCVEQSLPFGGQIDITSNNETWAVTGTSDRIKTREPLWDGLRGLAPLEDLAPADVQYLLLSVLLAAMDRSCAIAASDNDVRLSF